MAMFHIWNPYVADEQPQTIEFVLTRADADSVREGTREFFEQILKDLGVRASVKSWSVELCRSKYFTDFLGEEDWRDNWQLVWRARVETTKKIGKLPKLSAPWVETDATDETWVVAPDDDDAAVTCLVVADFDDEDELKKAQAALGKDDKAKKMREKYGVGAPRFARSEVLDQFPQLQIDLGKFPGKFFAKGADYAEQVMRVCQKAGGTVHFAKRLG